MPYELAFEKQIQVSEPEGYFNDECFGGDVVVDRLLPRLKAGYTDVWSNQEDWGWFIRLRDGAVKLGVDVYCDDRARGAYRIHLSGSVGFLLFWERAADGPPLDRLRELVEQELTAWVGTPPRRVQP
jgi:hypothetical protein